MHNPALVSILPRLAAEVDSPEIVLRSEICEDIVNAYKTLGDRVKGVELEGPGGNLHSLSALPLQLPIRLKLHPKDAPKLYTNTWLVDRFSLEALMDVDKGLLQGVKIAASAMVPVTMNLEELSDTSELLPVLNYYLHDTHVQIPVDFFHSMISACLRGNVLALPKLYPESPAEFLYVDELGRVTASARLARAGKFFGKASGGLQIDEESDLYKQLGNRKRDLVLSGSKCVSCETFDLCEGYLRFVDTNFDCEPFIEVFNSIKANAREIADDLAKAEKLEE
ncbi:MAG: hypothetical protein WBG50_02950 [Desulfomonilaceae bacterium]